MQLPTHVKCKPSMHEYVPWLRGPAYTIYPFIYLPVAVYTDLLSETPNPTSLATLAHEDVHFKRQKEVGVGWYGLKYVLLPDFRYKEELVAIEAQIKVLRMYGCSFDVRDRARRLASAEYLWCASHDRAFQDISNILKSL